MTDSNTLSVKRQALWVKTEMVGLNGGITHRKIIYHAGQKVSVILDAQWGTGEWKPDQLGYGVMRDDRRVAPAKLQWAVQINKPWNDPTMQELFASVPLKEHECYYLVISKLDLKTQLREADDREEVEESVYWLRDLYLVDGLLRQLKRHV